MAHSVASGSATAAWPAQKISPGCARTGQRFIIGAPKAELKQFGAELDDPHGWRTVHEGVEVKLTGHPQTAETVILCRSADRRSKERAIHDKFSQRIEADLERLASRITRSKKRLDPAKVNRQIGRILQRNQRAAARFEIALEPDRCAAGFRLRVAYNAAFDAWAQLSEGAYLLRSNITGWSDEQLWKAYIQLTQAEAAFRIQKDQLNVRPIWHQREDRVQAHMLVCFLAFVLWKSLEMWQQRAGLGNSPRTILEELARIQSHDVVLPTTTHGQIRLRCVTQPDAAQAALFDRLGIVLPKRMRLSGNELPRLALSAADGLLKSTTLSDQATEAQQKVDNYGFLHEQNFTQPLLWFAYVPQAVVVTYANAYGRFLPTDNLCGISFAATDSTTNKLVPLSSSAESTLFATSNGIPPTAGINLVNNSAGLEDRASTPDQDLTAALCFRTLATGSDPVTGSPAGGANSLRVRVGQQQVVANGKLQGVPVIIVDGRDDDILPPNFVARAYFGLNAQREGSRSQLHYYEVTNANHLDEIIALPGFDTTLIPLEKYFIEAMNLMYAHLRHRAALPPSQVVHTVPRGGTPGQAPQITPANVPNIARQPGNNAIVYSNGTLTIPQ